MDGWHTKLSQFLGRLESWQESEAKTLGLFLLALSPTKSEAESVVSCTSQPASQPAKKLFDLLVVEGPQHHLTFWWPQPSGESGVLSLPSPCRIMREKEKGTVGASFEEREVQ